MKRAILSIALVLACALSLFAAGSVSVAIRYFDKRIYYPGSEIAIKVSVTNESPGTFRFRLAENRVYSLDFDVRTPANRRVEAAPGFKRARADSSPVFYREISIEPGEEYSFVENLDDYADLSDPGTFAVQAAFWPELAPIGQPDSREAILSNVLMLNLRPAPTAAPSAVEAIRRENGDILRPEALPPDEVVTRTIEARQRSRWNEFFLYLDLEALLKGSVELARSYNRESDEGRRKMLEAFKAQLQSNESQAGIVTIPREFSVVETRYTPTAGFVTVVEKFAEKGYTSVKEYVYELSRRGDIWYIVGYSVSNKGTE